MRETYAPYDILVTDVDPGPDTNHLEVIVAGSWQEIGLSNAACGVSPWQCSPADNVLSFAFADTCYGGPEYLCATVSQESGHAFGLQHVLDCADPMTYLPRCGRQFFRDTAAPCGLDEPATCGCGLVEQSSHSHLMAVLGPNPTPLPGPAIEILSPQDGADVPETGPFSIAVDATDMRGIGNVSFYLNGSYYGAIDGHPYNEVLPYDTWTPADLPPGIIDVEVRAYDDLGTESRASITVTRGEPCRGADDCVAGQECDDGRCYFLLPRGELGAPCTIGLECISELCPHGPRGGYCTEWCEPSAMEPSCPDGFDCVPVRGGADSVCWPLAVDDGGCGCVAGGAVRRQSGHVCWSVFAMLAAAALGLRRFRRRGRLSRAAGGARSRAPPTGRAPASRSA